MVILLVGMDSFAKKNVEPMPGSKNHLRVFIHFVGLDPKHSEIERIPSLNSNSLPCTKIRIHRFPADPKLFG